MSLKDLLLNEKIAVEHLTLNEVIASKEKLNWIEIHELLVKGNYIEHVYSDYIDPVNTLLLKDNNLKEYYSNVGNAIKDFVKNLFRETL